MMNESSNTVRVRFAPSPTGYLHIGGARTVLFNWLVARQGGGKLVLRIEDTDRKRHVEDSVQKILDDLRWLGLNWDEGPDAGGEHGPYFQSQRIDTYDRYFESLLASGDAYYAVETPKELQALRDAAVAERGGFLYSRPDPLPTIEEGRAARKQGRPVVVRFKMPAGEIAFTDDILGPVMLSAAQFEDFVIQKSDGFPTYHFACVVDDELMNITHVLRGQEHLMNTPKHVAMQRALGFSTPHYAHLPVIFNMNGGKMSKRDKEQAIKNGEPPPEIEVHDFRLAGYLPEALVNFISLLGWSPGDDREQFDLKELVAMFSIDRIGKTNARFDRQKLISFNTDWAARLPAARLLAAFKDYLTVNDSPIVRSDDATLTRLLDACRGFRTFADIERKIGFVYQTDDAIEYDPKAVKKVLENNDGAGYVMLEYLSPRLTEIPEWTAEATESLLQSACEDKQVRLGQVAQPIRVAVTGTTISPSIGDTLTLLGRDRTLMRIKCCLAQRAQLRGL